MMRDIAGHLVYGVVAYTIVLVILILSPSVDDDAYVVVMLDCDDDTSAPDAFVRVMDSEGEAVIFIEDQIRGSLDAGYIYGPSMGDEFAPLYTWAHFCGS